MKATAKEQMTYLPLDQITVEDQVRTEFDEESLAGLAASIQAVGQLVPIRVRRDGDSFILVDGERRYRAAKLLGEKSIAAIIENDELNESDIVQRQLIANVQRADLRAMEKARAVHHLMQATDWNASEAAAHLGMSNATVSRLLALLALPEDIQQKIDAGEIPASVAYQISQVEDGSEQAELAEAAAAGRMTRDSIAGRRRRRKAGQETSTTALKRVTAMLGPGRSVTVTDTGLCLESFIELVSEVLEKARKVRASGVELSTFIAMLKDQSRTADSVH